MSHSFINRTSRAAIAGRVAKQCHRVLHAPFGKAQAITRVLALFKPIMFRTLSLRGLWADTDGMILPYVTVLLVVIIGFSVLALDGGRYVSLQSQLQHGVDQLALAAAAELDGSDSAITRANNAIQVTLDPSNSFRASTLFGASPNQYVTIGTPCYLQALPASDGTYPIPTSGCLANTPANARLAQFVQVTATPVTIPTVLPASFFGGSTFPTVATAVAGFEQNVCRFTPMYVCNPQEQAGDTYEQATQRLRDLNTSDPNDFNHRQMFSLRNDPGGSLNPGNYGFLASPLGNGVAALRESIGKVIPPACFTKRGVTTQPGFTGASLQPAFNVRLDLWDGAMNSHKNDADYAPGLNVRKGYLPASSPCGNPTQITLPPTVPPPTPLPSAMELPPDWCAATSSYCGNMVGNSGVWDFDTYWSVEHPSAAGAKPVVNGAPASNANLPSRYTVYKYEIAQGTALGGLDDQSIGTTTPPPERHETGRPRCNTNTPPASVDRRIIFVAVLNCRRLTADGVLDGGRNSNVPVAAFAKFFIIHPLDTGPLAQIDTEFVGLAEEGDHVVVNNVQLYR